MQKKFEKTSLVLLKVSAWCLVVLSILVTYIVVRRYVLKAPEPYSYEISTILVLTASILAVGGIQAYDRHLKVDFLLIRFSEKQRIILTQIIAPMIGLFYSGLMLWKSLQATLDSLQMWELSQSVWREPLWPIRAIVVLGVGILCAVLAEQLTYDISQFWKRREHDAR